MNEDVIKSNALAYLAAEDLQADSLDAYDMLVCGQLARCGWCAVLGQNPSGIVEKAALAVLERVVSTPLPNVILFCAEERASVWYANLLRLTGTEFMVRSGKENWHDFLGADISNLLIVGLNNGDTLVTDVPGAADFTWDLTIIDTGYPGEDDGRVHFIDFFDSVRDKSLKLLISSPVIPNEKDRDLLFALPARLLLKNEQAASALADNNAAPIITVQSSIGEAVRLLTYDIGQEPEESARIDGSYHSGGNIFEEYSVDLRRTYLHDNYSEETLVKLCGADKKLAVFLAEADGILAESPDNTIVVYTKTEETLRYLGKALSVRHAGELSRAFALGEDGVSAYDDQFIPKKAPDAQRQTRILLSLDITTDRFFRLRQVTHIFSYEYPDDAAVLHQRYCRRGLFKTKEPVFYLFSDAGKRFDGRMLGKATLRSLYKCFSADYGAAHILFHLEELPVLITDLLLDLKYVSDYTREVGASFDVIERYWGEYGGDYLNKNKVHTAQDTCDAATRILNATAQMFGVTSLLSARTADVDKEALLTQVTEKIAQLKTGASYILNENGELTLQARYSEPPSIMSAPFFAAKASAEAFLKTRLSGSQFRISDVLAQMPDAAKYAALIGIWKFIKKNGSEKTARMSYGRFVSLYNEGII